ncbi:hypothetical protein JCM24511_04878 [Saitozyma sp. JCM 24511]|nr:hypothetical protein JCM24511_04878 [Saitozyma sp. JCM 24511]
MSMRQPKPKQIRLPFSVPRPSRGAAPQARICGIQYTCPRCNVAYCSLDCFRDEKHSQCSEPFYRTTVMESIASDPKADQEEKRRMMEMLRRFEDAAAEGDEALAELEEEEEEEDEDDELAAALEGLDLDALESNQLFHLLPQAHRDRFLAALRNPESEDAKELLRSATERSTVDGGEGETMPTPEELPWWEAPEVPEEDAPPYALPPSLASEGITRDIKPPEGTGVKLAYNALAICLAYVHTLLSFRLPSLSRAHLDSQAVSGDEVKEELGHVVPFLLEPRSTVRYESARDAWAAVWEAIGSGLDPTPTIDLLIRLLTPLPGLIHPPLDTTHVPRILLLLSDLYQLFAKPKPGAAVPRKLAFYLAALRQLSRDDWLRLEREIGKEILKLQEENAGEGGEEIRKENPLYLA